MRYSELIALYPWFDTVVDRLARAIDAGLDAGQMLAWAEAQAKKMPDAGHRAAAREKVRAFVKLKREEGQDGGNKPNG